MSLTFSSPLLAKTLQDFAQTVALNKGRAFFVGGAVRDSLMGLPVKDVDIEVYGLSGERVRAVVQSHFSKVEEHGAAFGVLHSIVDGVEVDISLPRRDAKVAPGHTGFAVDTDPFLDKTEALRRRDFTVNAMLMDVLTGEIIDPFDGQTDVQNRILRVVDAEKFSEDPLRVLRGVQFAGRFALQATDETIEVLRTTAKSLSELSADRMRGEWQKLFLRAQTPGMGLELARQVGAFGTAQEQVEALLATPQEPEWHPEGDVWIHTRMVCDEAARICERDQLKGDTRLIVLLSALCHDLGKPSVTKYVPEEGRIRSKGHSEAGVSLVEPFLKALCYEKFSPIVEPLVRWHLEPYKYYAARDTEKAKTDGEFRRFARLVQPASLALLSFVAEADMMGRGPFPLGLDIKQPESATWFREQAERLGILWKKPLDSISGNALIPIGFKPGPAFKTIIMAANTLHDIHGWSPERILAACSATPAIAACADEEEIVRKLMEVS